MTQLPGMQEQTRPGKGPAGSDLSVSCLSSTSPFVLCGKKGRLVKALSLLTQNCGSHPNPAMCRTIVLSLQKSGECSEDSNLICFMWTEVRGHSQINVQLSHCSQVSSSYPSTMVLLLPPLITFPPNPWELYRIQNC